MAGTDFLKHPQHDQYPDTFGIEPHIYHRRWGILAVLNVSLVLVVLAVSSVNVLLPTLGVEKPKGLGASGTQLQWIVDSYALVFAGLLLVAGALGDRYGRKWALQIGLALFAIFAFASSQAGSPHQLILFRALTGIGAALIMPSTLSIIVNSFPMHERSKAIAIWAGFSGVGAALGPLSSGLLIEHFWWGSSFFVNIPVALLLLVAVALVVPNSKDPSGHALDFPGAALSVIGIVALVYGVIEGPEKGWFSPATIAAFAVAVIGIAAFVKYELHIKTPMLDPRLFKIAGFRLGSITVTLAFFCMFGMFFMLTQYFQYVKGYSPLSAAVHQLPSAAMLVLIAPQSPKIVKKLGVKMTVRLAFLFMTFGFIGMATLRESTSYGVVAVSLIVLASGIALCIPVASQLIVGSLPLSKAGVGSAVNDVTRELGGALGIAVLGSIGASAYKNAMGKTQVVTDLAAFNPDAADKAKDSFSSAQQAIGELHGQAASGKTFSGVDALAEQARHAFTHATPWAFGAAGIIVFFAFVLVPIFIPNLLPTRGGGAPVESLDEALEHGDVTDIAAPSA